MTNGVRQGGILSPLLFNLYMDDLSVELNECKTGCVIGDSLINHLMYADDLVILSPYSSGLQQFLRVCSFYGVQHDIVFNTKKSVVMIVRTKEDRKQKFPFFYLGDQVLNVVNKIKYLGHIIRDDLNDDDDVQHQCCKLYGRAHILACKFYMCTVDVKIALFRVYCTSFYMSHLWCSYSKAKMKKLQVAFNDALRILLKLPRWRSASQLFVSSDVPTLHAVLRNYLYSFMCRLSDSRNTIIIALNVPTLSDTRHFSLFWKHWNSSLYVFS